MTACATNALNAVKLDDAEMACLAEAEVLEPLSPNLGTKPRVHYKDLWRYNAAFIAGAVSHQTDGRTECLEGADVALPRNATQKRPTVCRSASTLPWMQHRQSVTYTFPH